MDITDRLTELAHAVADNNWSEFSMRIPAEPERDADLVLLRAAKEIESLRATISRLKGELKYIEIAIDDDELNLTNTAVECVLKLHASIAEKDSAISRLREYAWHKASCDRFPDLPFDCTCGYDELLAALEEAK